MNTQFKDKRKRNRKVTPPVPLTFIQQKVIYLSNCLFWLKEYEAGKVDATKAEETAFSIRKHGQDIINHLNSK